jgi:hypothetical protein
MRRFFTIMLLFVVFTVPFMAFLAWVQTRGVRVTVVNSGPEAWMRLGQIANMATVTRGAVAGAIWDMEDEELLAAIRWQLQQLSSRASDGRRQGHL